MYDDRIYQSFKQVWDLDSLVWLYYCADTYGNEIVYAVNEDNKIVDLWNTGQLVG